ncbi:MAG: hypothetical protein IMF11_18525 [Proteobacteria bacterium]|nr:hypothetical protein [Pseudomonadota bacterium]MCK4485211.1 hypothetical protein [Desulfobacterales bacterium]
MAIKIEQSYLVLVEGKDEQLLFEALMENEEINNIQILPIAGKTLLRRHLKALKVAPGFGNVIGLGVVRDADTDPAAAFQSVCDALTDCGLPVPPAPLTPGGNRPHVTVMILPDQHSTGMLESICLSAVAGDPVAPCVEQYFQCMELHGIGLQENRIPKAKVQVFLASREEPGKRLGEAAQAGYWPWNAEAFQPLKNFLRDITP